MFRAASVLFRMTWARILLLFECFEGAPPWDFFVLWACRNRFAKGTGTNPMFREPSVRFRMVLFKWVPIVCGFAWFFLFYINSKSDVSAFFRLRFRNGLGTKPAGVLPFRMRVPNTFFLSLVWWLAGFQVLRCAKVCLAWGNLFFLFLIGSKSNVSAVFWLRFRMVWAYIYLSF